jgi:glycosyltransferase involved in cell wall biosynthesis
MKGLGRPDRRDADAAGAAPQGAAADGRRRADGEALKRQAADSGVADRIRFVGRVPHEQVELYYALIDLLAYPRKAMRLTDLVTPLKPLEAMAQRKLVVASDVGGHRELIQDGVTGTAVPGRRPGRAGAGAGDPVRPAGRMGRAARHRALLRRTRTQLARQRRELRAGL